MSNKKEKMPTVEMHVGADGTFGVVIAGRMHNGKLNRDTGTVDWISRPKDDWTREAAASAASYLVGLTPRV